MISRANKEMPKHQSLTTPRRTRRLPILADARTKTPGYRTSCGRMLATTIEHALTCRPLSDLAGKVDLIFTSPPFPLTHKKAYGNLSGDNYLQWMGDLAPKLAALLGPRGSLVMEIGNAWVRGQPTMSTLPLETLLRVLHSAELHLCQQFICNNPARLPGPAQWVTVERMRTKDSYTHVWWMAPNPRPKADNRRVLKSYSSSMRQLLNRQSYNSGKRASGHVIREEGFLKDHGGAIPSNMLEFANTSWDPTFEQYLAKHQLPRHPARMAPGLTEFFIKFLTEEGDLILDPFAGSNTTGACAETLSRRWISVEANRDYVLGSRGRFPENIVKEV